MIVYPENLEYFSKENQYYKLIGIINHEGDLGKGHYYSYVNEKGSWYEYNDIKVEMIDMKKVLASLLVCALANVTHATEQTPEPDVIVVKNRPLIWALSAVCNA